MKLSWMLPPRRRIDAIWQTLGLPRVTQSSAEKVSGKPILVIVVLVFTKPYSLVFFALFLSARSAA